MVLLKGGDIMNEINDGIKFRFSPWPTWVLYCCKYVHTV